MDAATPTIHPTAVILEGAVLIGQVTVGENCFVGPNAVLRGDIEPIEMRANSNVQDCVVVHTHKGNPVVIGENTSVGHGAVIHGATVGRDCIIGMNAVLLDRVVVGDGCIVGAGSVVTERTEVPGGSLVVGTPGKVVKENDDRIRQMGKANGDNYQRYRQEYIDGRWNTIRGPLGPHL